MEAFELLGTIGEGCVAVRLGRAREERGGRRGTNSALRPPSRANSPLCPPLR